MPIPSHQHAQEKPRGQQDSRHGIWDQIRSWPMSYNFWQVARILYDNTVHLSNTILDKLHLKVNFNLCWTRVDPAKVKVAIKHIWTYIYIPMLLVITVMGRVVLELVICSNFFLRVPSEDILLYLNNRQRRSTSVGGPCYGRISTFVIVWQTTPPPCCPRLRPYSKDRSYCNATEDFG